MPLTRYQIRNEYGLADPELYRAADKDDPEALLEGVAMAGLVGVLRQLGDLAEFAAEIFHELHEEVMVTAARGHGLMVRVQQLESEFPSIEKAFLSQTTHSSFFSNAGIDWHPNLKSEENLITRGDLPRFVMDSYEESRAPPRLFLLDKFDVAGAGSCLKRYTDPSFYKMEASSYEMTSSEVHKDKKIRKTKKKGSRWRNGGTPEILPPSHVKLHQLFLEERVENGVSEPGRLVKLKRRPNKFPFDSKSGISYMEKLLETPLEDKVVHEIPLASSPLRLPTNISNASGFEALEISTVGSGLGSIQQNGSPCASPGLEENGCGQPMDDFGEDFAGGETSDSLEAGNIRHEVIEEKDIAVDDDIRSDGSRNGYRSDDIVSETDNFVDALATMESETETETESRVKTVPDQLNADKQKTFSEANGEQVRSQFSDSQSIGNSGASDDGNSPIKKDIASCSYSDTGSSSADDMLLDGGDSPQVIPSSGSRGTEIAWRSSDKVAVTEKIPVICHPELEAPSDSCIDVSKIATDNSGIGEVSSSSCPTDSALPVGHGAILTEATAAEPGLGEISSRHREDFDSLIKTEEHQINFVNALPSTSMTLDVPSPEKDYNPPSLLDERNSDDETDSEGPDVSSSAAIHFSKIAEATAEIEDAENSFGKVITKEHAEDGFERDLVGSQLSSPHSTVSHAEDESLVPSLPESNVCVPDIKPDAFVSPDDTTYPSVEIIVNSSFVADNPDTNSTEEQLEEIVDGVLAQSSDAEDIGVSCSTEKDLDCTFDGDDGVEVSGESTPMVDLVASDLPLEISKSSHPDQKSKLDERETETVQTQAKVMLAAASVPIDGDGDCNIDGNRDEGQYSVEGPVHNEYVISKSYVVTNDFESGTQKEQDQEAVTSLDLNSVPSTAVSYYPSVELLGTAPGSFLASEDGDENESKITSANNSNLQGQALSDLEEADQNGEIIGEQALSDLEEADQIGEIIGEVHVVSNHKASGTKYEIDEQVLPSPNLDSVPCTAVSSNHSNMELLGSYPISSMSTESKTSLHPGVPVTVSSSSNCPEQDIEPSPLDQVNHIEEPEDISSSSSHFFPDLRTSLVEAAEPQTNQLDEQLLHAPRASKFEPFDSLNHMGPIQHSKHVNEPWVGKIDVESNIVIGPISESSQSQETQSSLLDHERETHDNASSESCSATTSAQISLLKPPQSSINELNLSDHAKYPSTSVFSGFSLLPELPHINLQEMPPLPPLPPMQWRMGKMQNPSQTPGFPPLVDQKSQMGHSAMLGGNMQPASPFLAPSHISDNNSHVREDLTGNVMPSSPPLPQLTTHDTNQDVGPAEEGKIQPSANPLSPASNMAAAASTHSSETPHQKVRLPPDELSTGASLGTQEQNHHPSTISQEKVVKYVEEVMPQPTNHQKVLLPPDELTTGAGLGTQEQNHHPSTISQEKVVKYVEEVMPQPTNHQKVLLPPDELSTGASLGTQEQNHHPSTISQEKVVKYVEEVMPQPTNHQKVLLPPDELSTGASLGTQEQNHHPSTISQEKVVKYVEEVMPQPTIKNEQSQPSSDGEIFSSTSASSIPSIDDIRPTEIRPPKLLRPRSPLIDAVAAHDKSKLKKVAERVRPQPQKVEERDSLLEQIRAKSFNLKPAVPVRPSIHQGPKTNLKVAAILEKANAIRQAFAGSDEDDDSDSWSDS